MLQSNNCISISVVQTATIELVPSSSYDYATKLPNKEFLQLDPDIRKKIAERKSRRYSNSNNKTQRPRGYYYDGSEINKLIADGEVYLVRNNHNIVVEDRLNHGLGNSNIVVRYFDKNHPLIAEFLSLSRQLGVLWSKKGNKCPRSLIQGKMKHFGIMLGAGNRSQFHYSPTTNYSTSTEHEVNKIHRRLNKLAKTIGVKFFPEAVESMMNVANCHNKVVPQHLGGSNGLCCEMVQSQDSLVTESHVDMDLSLCFSIWSIMNERDVSNCDGWYFVLPQLQYFEDNGEKKGVVVELRHGVGIQWNGRAVFHGSTSPINESVNALGTFFGYTVV